MTPTAAGELARQHTALAGFSYRVTERLTARLGVSYTRDKFLQAAAGSSTNRNVVAEVGATYQIAERWTLDAGYRHTQARYAQELSEPRANVAFISIGYNWPESSFTNWVGSRADLSALPGAGSMSFGDTFGQSEPSRAPGLDVPLPDSYFIP